MYLLKFLSDFEKLFDWKLVASTLKNVNTKCLVEAKDFEL